MQEFLHGISEKFMFPLIPAYVMTIATTVAFDVDIKTIVAVVGLVLAQLWMGIKWGLKIESAQTRLASRLDNVDRILEMQDDMLKKSEKFDNIENIIHQSIKNSLEEVWIAYDKFTGDSIVKTIGRVL